MNIWTIIIVAIILIINNIIVAIIFNKVINKQNNKTHNTYSPYNTIIDSINVLRSTDCDNNNGYHLCVCDTNLVSLYEQGILNSTELFLHYRSMYGISLDNLKIKKTKCLSPKNYTLCITFDRFIDRSNIIEHKGA